MSCHRYKFCIAMENSISPGYVTEKVFDALAAGCVPVYFGSPASLPQVPDPVGNVIYFGPHGNASTLAELDDLLDRLGRDKAAYERLLMWKHKPVRGPRCMCRHMRACVRAATHHIASLSAA